MHLFLDIPLFFIVTFIGLSILALVSALILRILKLRHVADILELFSTAFFFAYAVQNWICYPKNTLINILLSSLATILVIYKIVFFVKGK